MGLFREMMDEASEQSGRIGELEERVRKLETDLAWAQAKNVKLIEATGRILGEGGQGKITVRDLCYTAFMRAKGKNDEDGGPTDWFNDTLPTVLKGVENLRQQVRAAGE